MTIYLITDTTKNHTQFTIERSPLDSKTLQIAFETNRLYVHSYKEEDFEKSLELYGDAQITKYFDYGRPFSSNEVKEWTLKCAQFPKEGHPFGLFSLFTKEEKDFVGHLDLLPTDTSGTLEIGFILHAKHHNKGFGTEAVKTFIDEYIPELKAQGFQARGADISTIIATVHPENTASKRVIEKAGLIFEKFGTRFNNAPRLFYSLHV
jgi:RimJ/RimL family protein N-acetyltransferase